MTRAVYVCLPKGLQESRLGSLIPDWVLPYVQLEVCRLHRRQYVPGLLVWALFKLLYVNITVAHCSPQFQKCRPLIFPCQRGGTD
ncbi:hypothetical protein C8R48DRAFT_717260 [Suillus tomentosus]|nr:hypothetical protein C8R48DRAFT_717260 [Suillus tomentosus]